MKLSEWIKKCVPKKAGINTSSSAFEPLSDAHAAYIKNLVEMAGKKDAGYKVFGSAKHKYRLNPVITLDAVHQFENQHHLTLPEEYVFFLTKVGNGVRVLITGFIPWRNWNGIRNTWGLTAKGTGRGCLLS